jgi:hypothetical protein
MVIDTIINTMINTNWGWLKWGKGSLPFYSLQYERFLNLKISGFITVNHPIIKDWSVGFLKLNIHPDEMNGKSAGCT